jgi:hypothetical protein
MATTVTSRHIPEQRLKQTYLQLVDIPTQIGLAASTHANRQAATSFSMKTALSPENRSFKVILLAHLLKQNMYNYQ